MTVLHSHPRHVFAGSPLDRADGRRKDRAWIAGRLERADSLFLPVWRSRSLVAGMARGKPSLAALDATEARTLSATHPWALLGLLNDQALFTLDLGRLDQPPKPDGAAYEDLRRMAGLLPVEEAAILAHARGLMHWRTRQRFCGICGGACLAEQAGHVMACTGCGARHFPRTDPAVIMRVTHHGSPGGERILLGQTARLREMGIFTILAGFVEPGETLEEAVAREVFEEAGVRVANVRYHSSQPWPFPASIMLGFTAEAVTEAIALDDDEMVAAGWFTRADLDRPAGFALPPPISIARRLIDDWRFGAA